MYCHQCGSFNPDDSNFCEKCGAALNKSGEAFVPAPADAAPLKAAAKKGKFHLLVWILVAVIVLAGIGTGIYFALSSQSQDGFQEQLSLGEKYLEELKYEDAIVALNRAIEIDPKNEKPYLLLADAYLATDAYDHAVEVLEQGLEATGGNQEIAGKLEELGQDGQSSPAEEAEPSAAPTLSPSPTPALTDMAQASLERVDASVTNDEGQVIVEQYYDKLVLEETCPEFAEINRVAQEKCDAFLEATNMEEFSLEMADPEYPFMNFTQGEITCNENGILSVRMQISWYMGGVFNGDSYGINFNLATGQELELTDVFSLDEDSLLEYLREQSVQYIQAHPDQGWWNDELYNAQEIVSEYTLSQYRFYIEGDTVYLCFPTYELGPGAMGSVVIPCPIQ